MTSRRSVLKFGLGALAAPALIGPAWAQTVNLRVQGFLPAASPTHRAFEKLAADLKEKSGGRLVIQVLPVGSVVGPAETINAVQAAVLDGHYSSSSFFAAKDAGFTVYGDTGASYDDLATRDRWYQEGGGEDLGRQLYSQFNMVYVANVFWPSEQIPARRPLRGVADLNGLKIRVPPGMIAEIFGLAGAAVVNLPAGEVFNALQSGVIDATDWASVGQNVEVGLYRAAKYSIVAQHSMPATEFAFAKRSWDRIPAELQQMLTADVRAMSKALKEQVAKDDEAAIAKIKADGVEIIEWPRAEIAKLRELTTKKQDELAARSPIAGQIVASHRAFQKTIAG